jgi:hypothetical protein
VNLRPRWFCLGLAVVACAPPPTPLTVRDLPASLSEVGLYEDLSSLRIADGVEPFAPRFPLWSDGAEKARWMALPEGAAIDTGDPAHWRFPVGTRLFKEFKKDGRRLETRVTWRVGDSGRREDDTLLGSYVWNDDETDARLAPDGAVDVRGTAHDVPSRDECWRCHLGEPGHVLGLSALQTDARLAPAVEPALGYLHANCAHCHNPHGGAWSDTDLHLALDVDGGATAIYDSTVGREVTVTPTVADAPRVRVVPGRPEESLVVARMRVRGIRRPMPPLGTERVHGEGLELVRRWVRELSER